jgi:homoserine/homoserine lactone efflux protein
MLAQKLIKWITANPKTINTISASVLVIIALIIVFTQEY